MKRIFIAIYLIGVFGCQSNVPKFDKKNAFDYLLDQTDLGPRNPGSDAYYTCREFIKQEMNAFADEVIVQDFTYTEQVDNQTYDFQNIIGRFNTEAEFQTIISAHWDTRPWAEKDPDKRNRHKPILGTNDGASGVAVLLELGRILSEYPPSIGVNIVFFDAEDLGAPGLNETYCAGSRYFAKHLPIPKPNEAINLDMVADKQLTLPIERYSYEQNPELVRFLWSRAKDMGLKAFSSKIDYAIYDDHVPLYEEAGIPAIDIIDFKYPNPYANFHHTLDDVVENCSAESLDQVGRLMVDYIYNRPEPTIE